MTTWRFWFPEDGDTREDAVEYKARGWMLSEDVARHACEYDFNERDGWERPAGQSFAIAVEDDKGNVTLWTGTHEPTVEHVVSRRAETQEAQEPAP